MKKTLLLFLIFISIFAPGVAIAQHSSNKLKPVHQKLSSHLYMLIHGDADQVGLAKRHIDTRPKGKGAESMVDVIIEFKGDSKVLEKKYGVVFRSIAGGIATADVPLRVLDILATNPNVIRIEESRKLNLQLDVSVPETGANSIWGTRTRPSPPPWTGNTGKNVVVGIVDTGIDLNHADFKDSSGKTRIISLWDQTNSSNGTHPGTYNYGRECAKIDIDALSEKMDLVVANPMSNNATILLGNGGGSFGSVTNLPINTGPLAVVAGDFNGDGFLDFVVLKPGNGQFTVRLGTGNGAFVSSSGSPFSVGTTPVAAAVGDFDRDGNLDLAVVSQSDNTVYIMPGQGDGNFGAPTQAFFVGTQPTSILSDDFNGDGKLDLAVTNYRDSTVSIMLGNGDGTFSLAPGSPFIVGPVPASNFPWGNYPLSIAVGDFNGDGKLDLATADWGRNGGIGVGSDLSILLGNGDGSFGPPTTIDTSHFEYAVAVGDFNGDGKLDLALASYSYNVTILLGNGDGTFQPPQDYPVGNWPESIAVGDFNGDGKLDLGVVNGGDNTISILSGNGDGTFGPATDIAVGTSGAANNVTFGLSPQAVVVGNFHSFICPEVDQVGHGTHVSGIAAGNGSAAKFSSQSAYRHIGMAPEANLIVVKSPLTISSIMDGIKYIEDKASALNMPVVINLSVGASSGPHDGTGILEASIDNLSGIDSVTGKGKVIVVAAGNEGDSNGHASGKVNNGQNEYISFNMPGWQCPAKNCSEPIILDVWYSGSDQLGVNLAGPSPNCLLIEPAFVYPGSANPVVNTSCGVVNIYTPAANASNGDHEIQIEIYPVASSPVMAGAWTIILSGSGCGNPVSPCVTNGSFDIWASNGTHRGSFFDHIDLTKTVTEEGTAAKGITVGSYVTKTSWNSVNGPGSESNGTIGDISSFSGRGPIRRCSNINNPVCAPGSLKPELAAPGEEIMSSYAKYSLFTQICFDITHCLDPDGQHVLLHGTSMATPHVTGAVAILLSQSPNLSSDQVKAALQQTRTDAFTDSINTGLTPNDTWGYGKLAVDLALAVVSPQVAVPNVVGLSQAGAQTALTAANLVLGTVGQANSLTVPVGQIISQIPVGGTLVTQGSSVNIVISLGTNVPDVVGLPQSNAQSAILAANLIIGAVTQGNSLTIAPGNIVNQNPAAGTSVAQGSAVDLVVSCGTKVPNLAGLTQANALTAVVGANLIVGTITQVNSLTVPLGSVVSQNPAAGICLIQGSPVDLLISGATVPDVVGFSQVNAQSTIISANLLEGTITQANSLLIPIGGVISENPPAGTSVAQGSAVDLVISSGPLTFFVPNVVGMTLANAQSAITGASLVGGAVTPSSSATVLAGNVISQSPVGGTSAAQGSAVDLVVSSGPPPVSVPTVVGMTQANAQSAITGALLTVGTVTQSSSATVLAGNVISQSPVGGTSAAQGSAVDLVVSSGPPQVLVPNVVGLTQANAQSAITGALLTIGAVTQSTSTTVAAGSVISQNPAAGASVTQGSAVNLVVSSGPPQVLVPNVVGLTQANAQSTITGALLTIGAVTQSSSTTVAAGNVISQSPAAGASVAQGSAVNLVVSTGSGPVNLTSSVTITRSGLVFNRLSNTFDSVVSITNNSTAVINGSPVLVISNISPATVNLANAAGINSSGNQYVNLLVPIGGLAPGQSITNVLLKFNNPGRVMFTFTTSVFSAP